LWRVVSDAELSGDWGGGNVESGGGRVAGSEGRADDAGIAGGGSAGDGEVDRAAVAAFVEGGGAGRGRGRGPRAERGAGRCWFVSRIFKRTIFLVIFVENWRAHRLN